MVTKLVAVDVKVCSAVAVAKNVCLRNCQWNVPLLSDGVRTPERSTPGRQ